MGGATRTDLSDGVFDRLPAFAWLEVDPRPLDWNGPATRPFRRLSDQDLQRPLIEHLERVARRHHGRIAIRDASTTLTFGEVWDAVSGLAERLAAATEPPDLIAILHEGLRYNPGNWILLKDLGEIYGGGQPRSPDPRLAAQYFIEAYQNSAKGRYEGIYERMGAYELVKLGDRASWEKAYEILKRHYDTDSRCRKMASVLSDLPVLEERLNIPPDRRIKPDVVAPGTDIASTKSSLAPISNFWGPYPTPPTQPTNPRYAFDGGTRANHKAIPHAAGHGLRIEVRFA